jgi:hypothetical protein
MKEFNDESFLLESYGREMSPEGMRRAAFSLLRLADSIDQQWRAENISLNYSSYSELGRIERNALNLCRVAIIELSKAKQKENHLGPEFAGQPAWNMLLELFQQFAGGAKVSTKSLQLVSGCPETTALRLITRLEDAGFLERTTSVSDRRVTLVSLSRLGVLSIGRALEGLDT